MASSLDMPLGDIIKANKKKGGARGGAGRQGGAIAKGSSSNKRQSSGGNAKQQTKTATRGGRQQPAAQKQNGGGNGNGKQQPAARKPRQQAKQTPVAAMRAQGRVQSRATTANRSSTGRANQLAARRGQAPIQQLQQAPAVAAGSQPVLVYQGPNGQQIIQPVALVQQPGQVGAQVIATGAATRTNGAPLFKVANRQQRQQGGGNNGGNGGNRRQSGGNQQQQQGGNQRQGGGRRRN